MPPPTPFDDVNAVLLDLWARVDAILGERALGMYLYGSLATGGYEPGRSDIDFVVVTDDSLAPPLVAALDAMHRTLMREGDPLVKKLEGAYVPRAVIRRHASDHPPVPFLNEGDFYLEPLNSDWVIQRQVLRETGAAVYGPPLHPLIEVVDEADVTRAIMDVLDRWWAPMLADPTPLQRPGYQPFAVLSMCRALHTITTGDLSPKDVAASWALDHLPAEWSPLIQHARDWRDGEPIARIDRTLSFMRMMIAMCHERASGTGEEPTPPQVSGGDES